MLGYLLNGGPFMILLFVLAISIIFISIKNINKPYNTNGIVLLGSVYLFTIITSEFLYY